MKAIHRLLAALLLVANATAAQADFDFPAVPTGGVLRAQFSLTSANGSPLPGIPISLQVLNGCGQVSPGEIVTDGAGVGQFDFTAGATPGVCVIRGSNGGTFVDGRTTIYRASDFSLTVDHRVNTSRVNGSVVFNARATANGVPLRGIPVSLDPLPASGPSGTAGSTGQSSTDGNGNQGFFVQLNNVPGVFDVTLRAMGKARVVRIVQEELPFNSGSGSGGDITLASVPREKAPIRLSVVEGPPSCQLVGSYMADYPLQVAPPNTSGFPFGTVSLTVLGCVPGGVNQGSVKLALEYPTALPPGAQVWKAAPFPETWRLLSTDVSGNRAIFTLADGTPGGSQGTTGMILATVGIASAGTKPSPRPIPRVQDMWWAGAQENGWGMSIAQSSLGPLFGVIYAYDGSGKPTWYVLPNGVWDTTRNLEHSATLYLPRGTPWYAYDAEIAVAGPVAGTATLTFGDEGHAVLDYKLGALSGRKQIERQAFGPAGPAPIEGIGGMWWGGPQQNGWGIAIMQQNATLFSVWFTYDETNFPTWFVMPGGGWSSGDTYEGRIYKTRGAPWVGQAYDPSKLQVTDVGAYKIRFAGSTATFDYTLEGRSGSLQLQRQAPF